EFTRGLNGMIPQAFSVAHANRFRFDVQEFEDSAIAFGTSANGVETRRPSRLFNDVHSIRVDEIGGHGEFFTTGFQKFGVVIPVCLRAKGKRTQLFRFAGASATYIQYLCQSGVLV